MRRFTLLLAAVGALAAAAVLAWRWWTAAPLAPADALAAAASRSPVVAEGVLVVADPVRTLRWAARHPQAVALLRLAAPHADLAAPRMRGAAAALAAGALGPLVLWWRGGDLAASAEVDGGSARALRQVAETQGVAIRSELTPTGTVHVALASSPDLLESSGGSGPSVAGVGQLSALARVGDRWWQVRAGRSTLEATSGSPPELPGASDPAVVTTADIGALAAAVAPVQWVPHGPACLVLEGGGWGVALPATTLSLDVRRLLSLGGDTTIETPTGAHHWRGLLGDLWVLPGPGLAVASRPDLLGRLPRGPIAGESGAVRGTELARLVRRFAEAADRVPGNAGVVAGLRRAVPVLEALRRVRWRLLPQGGRILLEW
jgi:hypothetical protein